MLTAELADLTRKTLALMKDATTQGIVVNTGLQYYDLEAQAKRLYPVLTPLRNRIPRVKKPGYGIQPNWKAITAINSSTPSQFVGVSEGHRGAKISLTEKDYSAPYKGIGLENSATFESTYASEGFDDVRSLAQITTLEALMIGEENMILTGNTSMALGTTPTPTGVASGSDGSFGAGTAFFFCVALTPFGVQYVGGTIAPTTSAIPSANWPAPTFTKNNADGSSDVVNGGVGQISAQGSIATGANNHVVITVAPVKGAAGYAWYVGTTTGAANCFLAAITDIPTVTVLGPGNASNQAANAAGLSSDHSTVSLAFDGLTTFALNGVGGKTPGYYATLSGGPLTSDGHGGVTQIETAFQYFWDNFRISRGLEIWVGSRQAKNITNIVLSGTTNPVYNLIMQNGAAQGDITAGALVTSYLNRYSLDGAQRVPVRVHPFMPQSWIFFNLTEVPYPNANVPGVARIVTRQEYYSKEWPIVTREYDYGVYADEVLQHYIPLGLGVLADCQ
ncbi:MAG TPA: hypothetical protein VFB23_12525 [Candidatus Acidoferrales bacterium]|nr:hypothetical protein [Candidatus Acidoferrales bacterium]